uniref:Uncharacterized protein n=1 Tax=Dicentrarchus labrax TaxID=13489 RepID=A0A8C4IQM9_DICLA
MDLRSTLLVIGGSACSFKLLNLIVRFLPAPETARKKAWKWRNTTVLCLYHQPQMLEDVISSRSTFSHSLVSVSTGDTLPLTHTNSHINTQMYININRQISSCHVSTVTSCLSLAVTSRLYLGFSVVLLLMEINSVFLNIRQLLLLLSLIIVSYCRLLVFRVSIAAWITPWLAAAYSLSLISTMNIGLFYKLFRADILTNTQHQQEPLEGQRQSEK